MDWIKELDIVTKKIEKHFNGLTTEKLNWKPSANSWSIAQNLDHLIVVNETYYPVIAALKTGTYKAPFIAKFDFMVSFLGKAVLKAVQPDRRKKMRTFPIWEPTTSNISESILHRFETHQMN